VRGTAYQVIVRTNIPVLALCVLAASIMGGCEAPPELAARNPGGPPPPISLAIYDGRKLDVLPVATHTVAPEYPFALRLAGLNGWVLVNFVVSTDGTVGDVSVAGASDARFGEAATLAVVQWTFTPGRKDGRPAACRMQVPIMFELGDTGKSFGQEAEDGREGPVSNPVPPLPPGVYQQDNVDEIPVPVMEFEPKVPATIQIARRSQKALILCTVEPDGQVDDVIVEKASDGRFGEAAARAVGRWLYRPAAVDESPVPCRLEVPVTFEPNEN
jgi:TonB family protein